MPAIVRMPAVRRYVLTLFAAAAAVLPLRADIPGATVTPLAVSGSANPVRLAAGPDGNVWFIDEGTKAVGKLTMSGSTATTTTYPIVLPAGQAVFNGARAIAGGPDAVWFVVQGCSNSSCANATADLGRITPDGTMSIIPISGANNSADRMVIGPDGNIWYSDSSNNAIVRVTPQGSATTFATTRSPHSLVVGPDQNIWFGEGLLMGRITTSGAITEFPVAGADVLTVGPDGNLWYANQSLIPDKIGRLTTTGQETLFTLPEKAFIGGLAAGPDGNIWFTEHFSPKIGQFVISSGTANIQSFSGFGKGGDIVPFNFAGTSSISGIAPESIFNGFIASFFDFTGGGILAKIAIAAGEPDLTVSKGHFYRPGEWTTSDGQTFTGYTFWILEVKNAGQAPTTGTYQVTDALPSGFKPREVFLSRECTFDAFARSATCTSSKVLPPGDHYTFLILGETDVPDGTTVTNQATVSGGGETNTANDMSNVDSFTVGKPVVEVTKSHSGDRFLGTFQWAIRIKNVSSVPTSGPITITDQLPAGVTLQPFGQLVGATCTVSGSTVTCTTDGPLGPGRSVTIPLPTATVPKDGPLVNTVTASGGGIDPTLSRADSAGARAAQPASNPAPRPTNGRR